MRMLILKRLFDWSYDDLEHEVRADPCVSRVHPDRCGRGTSREDHCEDRRALGPAVVEQLYPVAGRRTGADPRGAAHEYDVGIPARSDPQSVRSVTRGVLTIAYQARSPKTRPALAQSYRALMATTRAVVRDTETMIRPLGQRRPQRRPRS